jgi:uncharacterized Zn finger protein
MAYYDFYQWKPYVPVAQRRLNAEKELQKLRKKGHPIDPVVIEGRTIARTFWGKAWCDNLESYQDFAYRLQRGRSYVRNGSVVDLQLAAGEVTARVSGSELYEVKVKVTAVVEAKWKALCRESVGSIDSLVELLQGRFSQGVMDQFCRQGTGLFPSPMEIEFSCTCPDWAAMCKHVAAVLYGVGARLDMKPELLFQLRKVDENELLARAASEVPSSKAGVTSDRVLESDGLSELFGLEMEAEEASHRSEPSKRAAAGKPSTRRKARAPARTQGSKKPQRYKARAQTAKPKAKKATLGRHR